MADAYPNAKDLRALPKAELAAQLDKLRQELWQGRLKAREGALKQTHVLPRMRQQIARVETVLREGT